MSKAIVCAKQFALGSCQDGQYGHCVISKFGLGQNKSAGICVDPGLSVISQRTRRRCKSQLPGERGEQQCAWYGVPCGQIHLMIVGKQDLMIVVDQSYSSQTTNETVVAVS